MSEYFTGITFPEQKVTPSHDAIIRRATLADGILHGCDLSYSGYTLTMGAGVMIACGRQFSHTSVQNWAVSGATSGYARLVLTIDTTRASTKKNFDQIVDSIEYASALDGFLALQQQDINQSGTIYQMVVCVVSLGAGGITGIVDQIGATGVVNKPKAGFIYPLAADLVPEGFLLCDGAAYSRTEYPELFAAIGTMYGSGDGSTTFNVPDLRERVPAGSGENHAAGEMVGEETHQLTVDEMPIHTPKLQRPQWYNGDTLISGTNAIYGTTGSTTGKVLSDNDVQPVGGDQPHNIMQPTTYIKGYIIATGKGTGVSVSDIIMGAQALPLGLPYGGLGATDPKTARENLKITPENIGALSMELLWENASPTSEFAAQDVAADLQEGSFYAIEWLYHGTGTTRSIQIACVGISTMIFSNDSGRVVRRNVDFDPSKLTFSTVAGTVISSAPSTVTDNMYLIPTKIYIIKGASA